MTKARPDRQCRSDDAAYSRCDGGAVIDDDDDGGRQKIAGNWRGTVESDCDVV